MLLGYLKKYMGHTLIFIVLNPSKLKIYELPPIKNPNRQNNDNHKCI